MILLEESADLIRRIQAPLNGLPTGSDILVPLDIDVSPFDKVPRKV